MGRRSSPLALRVGAYRQFELAFFQENHYAPVLLKTLAKKKQAEYSLSRLGWATPKISLLSSSFSSLYTLETQDKAHTFEDFFGRRKKMKRQTKSLFRSVMPRFEKSDFIFSEKEKVRSREFQLSSDIFSRPSLFFPLALSFFLTYLRSQKKKSYSLLTRGTFWPSKTERTSSLRLLVAPQPWWSSSFILHLLQDWIEKNPKDIRSILQSVCRVLDQASHIQGYKILCSGRIGGIEKAKKMKKQGGSLHTHSFHHRLDYGAHSAHTMYGLIGLKLWLCYEKSHS